MPDQTDPTPPEGAANEVSTDRRGFFAQILGLGLDGAEHIGRHMGRRFGDALATMRDATPADPPPSPPAADDNVPRQKGDNQLDL